MPTKITIIKVRRTPEENVNQELQWLGSSLGLFNQRDKDSSCFRVFITLIRKARQEEPLSSDEIAGKLHLTRGTVVHHLDRLMESGLVIHEKEGYLLRENNMERLMGDLHLDLENVFSELKKVAKEIDEKIG